MIIKSKFKDYYDYIGKTYGEDPSIVYVRNDLPNNSDGIPVCEFGLTGIIRKPAICSGRDNNYLHFKDYTHYTNVPEFKFKYLVVCGRLFLLVSENLNKKQIPGKDVWTDYEVFSAKKFPRINKIVVAKFEIKKKQESWRTGYWDDFEFIDVYHHYAGHPEDSLLTLSKRVGQPVFVVNEINYDTRINDGKGYTEVEVSSVIPILNSLNFSCISDPVNLFYCIQEFITNVLRVNPDKLPPVEVDNKDKIVQHGFDLDISFRHRKNNS
jgi:hypothetical protein